VIKGLVCIATGQYIRLVDKLISACGRVGIADHIFCLTDNAASLRRPESRIGSVDILYLPWGSPGWPFPTLWRYHAISLYSQVFQNRVSHLLYCDVDMRPLDDCSELFGQKLVAVTHPGYWSTAVDVHPYERRPQSGAFLEPRPGGRYVAGGIQGGPVARFLPAASEIRDRIQQDYLHGITAVWHDESHWNHYVSHHACAVTIVGPEFCWPESWPVPDGVSASRLLALDKNHHHLRGTKPSLREASRRSLGRIRRTLGVRD
jgi:histo-blood group ABO system transferase